MSIQVGRGETLQVSMTYEDENGNPVDLTGHTVTAQVLAPNSADAAPLVSSALTVDANGNIDGSISADSTLGIAAGTYVLLVKDEEGGIIIWLYRDKLQIVEASEVD